MTILPVMPSHYKRTYFNLPGLFCSRLYHRSVHSYEVLNWVSKPLRIYLCFKAPMTNGTTNKTGDFFIVELEVKYPSICGNVKMCKDRFRKRVHFTVAVAAREVTFRLSFTNNTTSDFEVVLESVNQTVITSPPSMTTTSGEKVSLCLFCNCWKSWTPHLFLTVTGSSWETTMPFSITQIVSNASSFTTSSTAAVVTTATESKRYNYEWTIFWLLLLSMRTR